jgi:hypothetical protein
MTCGWSLLTSSLTGYLLLLFLRTEVDMNLRAGTAGTCVAHLPEVVVLVAVDDVVLREVLLPVAGSLVIASDVLRRITFKDGHIEVLGSRCSTLTRYS